MKSIYSKSLFTIALAWFALTGVFGQYVGPTATYDASTTTSDYVTIGSRMPYYVAPDNTIKTMVSNSLMNPSVFKWMFLQSDGSTVISPAITPATYANGTVTPGGIAGYIKENEISVIWTGSGIAAGSNYKISATEHSNPLSAVTDGCDGSTVTRDVYVLPRPTVSFPTASAGGCGITPGASSTYYVPLNVTGLGKWEVTYSVTYNGNAYIASTTSADLGTATSVSDDAHVVAEAAASKTIEGTPTGKIEGIPVVLNGGGAANGYGYYDVTITNVTDRISRKSLDLGLVSSQSGDFPATSFRIYVNPTPVTTPIQHVANL